MHHVWNNLDFSHTAYLRTHMLLTRLLRRLGFVDEAKWAVIVSLDPQIIYWDLRKGLPYDNDTFDVVYHSHLLEHLDRKRAPDFLRECRRVLKPGGILRVVVPDLALYIQRYCEAVTLLERGLDHGRHAHSQAVWDLFFYCVRTERLDESQKTYETNNLILQKRIVRWLFPYDAVKMGELHRWMYDRYSLQSLLIECGFREPRVETATTSRINGWVTFCLDTEADGTVYKPESLIVEAIK
jgi:predicted SAM-dependent methyltransferase